MDKTFRVSFLEFSFGTSKIVIRKLKYIIIVKSNSMVKIIIKNFLPYYLY